MGANFRTTTPIADRSYDIEEGYLGLSHTKTLFMCVDQSRLTFLSMLPIQEPMIVRLKAGSHLLTTSWWNPSSHRKPLRAHTLTRKWSAMIACDARVVRSKMHL